MSDNKECPFEVGNWVTNGEVVGRIVPGVNPFVLVWSGEAHDDVYWPHAVDWAEWSYLDLAHIHEVTLREGRDE